MRTHELRVRGWRVWVLLGRNTPPFMAQRDSKALCYLFHVPFVSIAVVNWDAL